MKKLIALSLILSILCLGCSNVTSNFADNELSDYTCENIKFQNMNETLNTPITMSSKKLYGISYDYGETTYKFGRLENKEIEYLDIYVDENNIVDVFLTNDKIYTFTDEEECNKINIYNYTGEKTNELVYPNYEYITGLVENETDNIYFLKSSLSDNSSSLDIYDKEYNKKCEIVLSFENDKGNYCYHNIVYSETTGLCTVRSIFDEVNGEYNDFELIKVSEENEKLKIDDTIFFDGYVTSLDILNEDKFVISEIENNQTVTTILNDDFSISEIYRTNREGNVIVDSKDCIYFCDNKNIYNIDDDSIVTKCDGIIESSNESSLLVIKQNTDSMFINISEDENSSKIKTKITSDFQVLDIEAKNDVIYLLLIDKLTYCPYLYSYDNGNENFYKIPNVDEIVENKCVIRNLCVKDSNSIVFSDENIVYIYNIQEDVTVSREVNNCNDIKDICISKNNGLALICSGVESNFLALEKDKEFQSVCSVEDNSKVFSGINDFSVLVTDKQSIYGVKSDNSTQLLYKFEDNTLDDLISLQYYESDEVYYVDASLNVYKLSKNTISNSKTDINVVCFSKSKIVTQYLVEYGEKFSEYNVKINDYSEYKREEAIKKLDLDIISGKSPDIIVSSSFPSMDKYEKNDVFEDLLPYINNDKELNFEDYIESIMNMNMENGHLYSIAPQFGVVALIGGESVVNDINWGFEDIINYKTNSNCPIINTSREKLLNYFMGISEDRFVDFSSGKVDFDNNLFRDILQFCKDNGFEDDSVNIENENSLLTLDTIISYSEYNIFEKTNIGEKMIFKGLSNQKNNNIAISFVNNLYICSDSEKKDEAWSIIRKFLLDEYQDTLSSSIGSLGFPIKKSSLEKSRKFAQTLPEEEQYWNNETEKMKVGVINDASADYLTNLIENATLEYHNDAIISNIIQQEANEYFNYNLSVEETSKRIQNKVLIYLNETK